MAINYVHHSGRFDFSVAALIKGFDHDRTVRHADIIAYTEVSAEERAAALQTHAESKNWGFYRSNGGPGKDDCALLWDAEKYALVTGYALILTDIDTYAPTGRKRAPFGATFVVLKELASGDLYIFCVAHTPSHVQMGGTWQKNNRARQHRVGCARINKEMRKLRKKYREVASVISMDLNLDVKKKWVRNYLVATFPRYTLLLDKNPESTHASRTIDVVLVSRRLRKVRRVDAYRVVDSDHKAIIVRLVKRILKRT